MGSGLRVAQRCRSAQAGDVADLTRAGESGDHAVLLGSSCRFRSHGWIPMAADDSIDRWRRLSLAVSIRKRGSAGFLSARPSLTKLFAFGRVPRCARPRLAASALFRRSGRYGRRNLAQAPEHVGSNQHGQGGGAAAVSVVFRRRHCRLSSVVNWFRLGAFFHLARPTLTLLAGDFVPGFQDCPERAGP